MGVILLAPNHGALRLDWRAAECETIEHVTQFRVACLRGNCRPGHRHIAPLDDAMPPNLSENQTHRRFQERLAVRQPAPIEVPNCHTSDGLEGQRASQAEPDHSGLINEQTRSVVTDSCSRPESCSLLL